MITQPALKAALDRVPHWRSNWRKAANSVLVRLVLWQPER